MNKCIRSITLARFLFGELKFSLPIREVQRLNISSSVHSNKKGFTVTLKHVRTHFSVDLRSTNNKSQTTHTDSYSCGCVFQSSYIEVQC